MSFLTGIINAAVEVVKTPFNVVQDVVDVAEGKAPTNTIGGVGQAIKNVGEGIVDLSEGDV